MTTSIRPPATRPQPGEHELRLAWLSVALVPVGFLLAIVAGEGLIDMLGYDPENETVPVWAALLAGIPALVLLMAPAWSAAWFGHRADLAGRSTGRVLAWTGGVVALAAFVLNVAAFLVGR